MSQSVSITILVDNRTIPGLTAEHGLSLWIETAGRRFLFDTGQGGALVPNASTLGIDLAGTDTLVLSHGHYDHTGGIPRVLQAAGQVEAYCHPGVASPRYGVRSGAARPIHMPRQSVTSLEGLPVNRVHWVRQPVSLSENVGLTGEIPREHPFEDTGGPFYLDPEGRFADSIDDDLALWIRTDGGLVVCVGCCHAGLLNTLHYIQRLNGGMRIRAVIGGFHLLNAGRERLDWTVSALLSLDPDRVIPCHCTGEHASAVLLDALGRKGIQGLAGLRCRFQA
ncbi:MAG: MBL fold metallo-hydrolase [Syntrophaceae bacterium]|nr:MBL fold metallo-hydrolase [Syntrophaceae bacterium]